MLGAMSGATKADRKPSLYTRITWRILPVIFVAYCVNFLDRVNVSFAQLEMSRDLGMDPAVYGFAAGLFFVGYFVLEIPSNLALHRFGARLWLARIVGSWGVVALLTAMVQHPWQFAAARFLLGIAEAGFYPGIMLYLSWWYPARLRAQIVGSILVGIAVSSIVGGPFSGWILDASHGWLGVEGWRWMFALEGIPCFLVAIWIAVGLPDRPEQTRWLSDRDKSRVARLLNFERMRSGIHNHCGQWVAFRTPMFWVLATILTLQAFSLYAISFWLPQVIKSLGVTDPLRIGWLSAVPWLIGVALVLLIGRSSDARLERRWHGAGVAALGATGFLMTALGDSLALDLVGMTLAVAGVIALGTIVWSIPAHLFVGVGAAVGFGAINAIANLGGFFSPTLIGLIVSRTHQPALGQMAPAVALAAAALVAALFLPRQLLADNSIRK